MQCTGATVQQRGSAGFGCNSEPRSGVCSHHLTQRPTRPACCANASQARSPCQTRQFARSTLNPETSATMTILSTNTTWLFSGRISPSVPSLCCTKTAPASLSCLWLMRVTGLRDLQMKKLHKNAGLFQVESFFCRSFALNASPITISLNHCL